MNARQISQKAEVDLEMVLACLRVLRHHGIVTIIDMYFYTNRYECTDKVSNLLLSTTRRDEGKGISNDKSSVTLLQQAVDYIVIDKERDMKASPLLTSIGGGGIDGSLSISPNHYNYGSPSNFVYNPTGIDFGGHSGGSGSSYQAFLLHNHLAVSSFHSHHQTLRDVPKSVSHHNKKDYDELSVALVELYCSCHRGISIGDLILSLVSSQNHENIIKSQNLLNPFSTNRKIDWKKICGMIDHRRFAIFGIVNGLLKRVHNYPIVIHDSHEAEKKDPDTGNESSFSPTRVIQRDYDSFALSPSAIISDHSNNKQNNRILFSRLKKKKSLRYGGSVEDHKHIEQEYRKKLQSSVASMMNGLHCDDELVSNFNMPLTHLFNLVAPNKGINEEQQQSTMEYSSRIVSVYAIATNQDNMSD
jgi:Nitrogen permease regulator 2